MNVRMLLFLLTGAAGLAGCNHPYARFATLQDPKYPVGRDSKIALAEGFNPSTANLATRLAGETIEAQMRVMGFHLAPLAEADFVLNFTIGDKDVSQSYTVSVPTISNMVGTAGDRTVTGTVFGSEVVPQTRIVSMTELALSLTRTQEPKVEVWSGRIGTESADAQKYRTPFFRALLENVGATARGAVQLDAETGPGK